MPPVEDRAMATGNTHKIGEIRPRGTVVSEMLPWQPILGKIGEMTILKRIGISQYG